MINRIIKIRKDVGLSQKKFAERIGLSRNFINQVEAGKKNVSDRTISDICREFNINEDWLRYETGAMYSNDLDEFTQIAARIDQNDPKARKAILDYWKLSDKDKKLFWSFIERFTKKDGED